MTLIDEANRRRILNDLDTTILVEAAAGTGKTSLMAGRVAISLAMGRLPQHLAAITFTELAAAELSQRIYQTVHALLDGQTPVALKGVLPEGLKPEQMSTLAAAARDLDQLTTTTIHGFCQTILRSHAVSCALDPGTKVMDAPAADAMFENVFSQWLTQRLSDNGGKPEDPLVVLSEHAPLRIVTLIRNLSRLRREQPTAHPLPMPAGRFDIEFTEAVNAFARWYRTSPGDKYTADRISDLEELAAFYNGCLAAPPSFADLWLLSQPPRVRSMKRDALELQPYRRRTGWKAAHGAERGERLADEAEAHIAHVDLAYRQLLGCIGQGLISKLSDELDDLLDSYQSHKRAAAVVDFDDLLIHARDLVTRREDVRIALSKRYQQIFVDEFQDTDPVQAEILFHIAAVTPPTRWQEAILRPGALFLVGDPKQAIYRFRGADIAIYNQAKTNVLDKSNGSVIPVTANFRSRKGILDHVNARFTTVLSQTDQPGYVALSHTLEPPDHGLPCIAKLTIDVPQDANAAVQRDTEADAVADICEQLIGAVEIHRQDGTRSVLRAGDIALLAPTNTELWRYERALEAKRITVASQAGRTLFLRQETQDVLALLRTLADASDTLAFGALMRGPLVGLTDSELLDIADAVSTATSGRPFSIRSNPEHVPHVLARAILERLQALRRRAGITTPFLLLSQAIEEFHVRVTLAARHQNRSARALANIDALIERARPYGVAGLQAFVRDLQRDWEAKTPAAEGRTDATEDAVELVTMHSSKGLEWPVVIPINTSTRPRSPGEFVHRRSDNTLHWVLGDVPPPELDHARAEEHAGEARERERLWYVTCTRARDLLIVPSLPAAGNTSWSRVVDLGQAALPEIDLSGLQKAKPVASAPALNEQTLERFAAEAIKVQQASPPLDWQRPSDHDADRSVVAVGAINEFNDTAEVPIIIGAGRKRGLILHKLMEEFLTGELEVDPQSVLERTRDLLDQIVVSEDPSLGAAPDAAEMSATALRTIQLPDIAQLRPNLVPEFAVWSEEDGTYVAGRADALAVENDRVTTVLDWKSDVAPTSQDRAQHATQLSDYRKILNADRSAIIYMTTGEVCWI